MKRIRSAIGRRSLSALMAVMSIGTVAVPARAGSDFRQIGYFRSVGANVSVGNAHVRVVTVPIIPPKLIQNGFIPDSAAVARLYPGWDFRGNLVIHYALTPEGYRQERFLYGLGVERKALPDDPVSASLGLYDQNGERRAKIPADLHALIGADVPIVAAQSANVDGDSDSEWVVVAAGPWDEVEHGARMNISLVDRREGQWKLMDVLPLDEPRRAGPLEVRDVTGDGEPDVVFRTFHAIAGQFWVEARVFSAHIGLPGVLKPPVFIPRGEPAKE